MTIRTILTASGVCCELCADRVLEHIPQADLEIQYRPDAIAVIKKCFQIPRAELTTS
jgi:hypothetical protein